MLYGRRDADVWDNARANRGPADDARCRRARATHTHTHTHIHTCMHACIHTLCTHTHTHTHYIHTLHTHTHTLHTHTTYTHTLHTHTHTYESRSSGYLHRCNWQGVDREWNGTCARRRRRRLGLDWTGPGWFGRPFVGLAGGAITYISLRKPVTMLHTCSSIVPTYIAHRTETRARTSSGRQQTARFRRDACQGNGIEPDCLSTAGHAEQWW